MKHLAIIVPYRDRARHLFEFVNHMRKRFKDSYIYVIEQLDSQPFNRGKLLNIGYKEFAHLFDYCAFHDVDMLPTKADYSPPSYPTLLATRAQQFRYEMPFEEYFGGVVLFNHLDFCRCGGYSNNFWGWGGEDNELYNHLRYLGIPIHRRNCYFQSLYHKPALPEGYSAEKMAQSRLPRRDDDGFAYAKYTIENCVECQGYTKLSVRL